MAVIGIGPSEAHPENGMTLQDMVAAVSVAKDLDEVIIFRSTGPWAKRWIKRKYPTKNFHVKGKSSDWGPQAGFVPYEGIFSKVGDNPEKAKDGTDANNDGLKSKYASKRQLILNKEELHVQLTEEASGRTAIQGIENIAGSEDKFLVCERSGDRKPFVFRAVWNASKGDYLISCYSDKAGTDRRRLLFENQMPFEVMTSSEIGAGNKPMTGDYDLMAVCPRWANYMERTQREVSKPGLNIDGKGIMPGQSFGAGSFMDKVLDMRTNTGAVGKDSKHTYQGMTKKNKWDEHDDMGNLTPRILRCINALNAAMHALGKDGAFRRVHHNAESHRNHIFGALVKADMEGSKKDGFPLTVFQPARLTNGTAVSKYSTCATLENMAEFKEYAGRLNQCGYYVPRNWTWGMSVRDRADHAFGHRINV
jgi:hypothetical protein